MKKTVLIFTLMVTFSITTFAQVIENFESIGMNLMLGGSNDNSYIMVTPNPDSSGINKSAMVAKFYRDIDGLPWGGFYSLLSTYADFTINKYVHVKVWKPRISPIKFKIEGGPSGNTEVFSISPQTATGAWEEVVFDFSMVSGEYPTIVFMPDFLDPVGLVDDIEIFFDDIVINNDPLPGSVPVQVIEDYEYIPMNMMLDGPLDYSYIMVVPNPDPSGINISSTVSMLYRDKDGLPWCGFWSALPEPVDVTGNKYIHAMVWKPRITPVRFKLEGGPSGNLEVASTNVQDTVWAWEDMVFDFSTLTGVYPTIVFMPDFLDPVGLVEDITIYFDNIVLNDSPNPITTREVTFNVDMRNSLVDYWEPKYISGNFGGVYGSWTEPGTNYMNQLYDPDYDSIFSITMQQREGVYEFKFFSGNGWGGGEWPGNPNRIINIKTDDAVNCIWGFYGFLEIDENSPTLKVSAYPVPFDNSLEIKSAVALKSVIITSADGKEAARYENLDKGINKLNTSNLHDGVYVISFISCQGERQFQKILKIKQ